MNLAIQKSVGLLLLIIIGFLLQKKLAGNDSLKGVKVIILSIALPATIFVALLKIELAQDLLLLPLLALLMNFLLFGSSYIALSAFGIKKNSSTRKTLLLLLPSLAPGLSCFPFLMEYLGENELALAALADVGNKIFVLIFLYLLAVHWFHQRQSSSIQQNTMAKVRGLLLSMINEPINVVIIIALIMLGFGFQLSSFPAFLENEILRLSSIMTPLVLLFIGMAVKINWKEFNLIFFLLSWRAGIAFCLSAIIVFLMPALSPSLILLLIVFPQSSCSFWPFAHMTAINNMEEHTPPKNKTFNTHFGLSVLACSLPFSTLLILCVFSFQSFFINPIYCLYVGVAMLIVSLFPFFITKIVYKKIPQSSTKEIPFFSKAVDAIEARKAS
ncbi:permease [Marivirga lumbricoides]|uniref:Permease n=1 Tax=Marivirga lumbricoides TaxID=1046115 RepID=A0A2T4DQX6_9BACT|nr:permease [Marivirga lumbricoides]